MKRNSKVFVALAAIALALVGCSQQQVQTISGPIQAKYIEDFTEPTLVVKDTASGEVHHFTVEWEIYNKYAVNQTYTQTDSGVVDD